MFSTNRATQYQLEKQLREKRQQSGTTLSTDASASSSSTSTAAAAVNSTATTTNAIASPTPLPPLPQTIASPIPCTILAAPGVQLQKRRNVAKKSTGVAAARAKMKKKTETSLLMPKEEDMICTQPIEAIVERGEASSLAHQPQHCVNCLLLQQQLDMSISFMLQIEQENQEQLSDIKKLTENQQEDFRKKETKLLNEMNVLRGQKIATQAKLDATKESEVQLKRERSTLLSQVESLKRQVQQIEKLFNAEEKSTIESTVAEMKNGNAEDVIRRLSQHIVMLTRDNQALKRDLNTAEDHGLSLEKKMNIAQEKIGKLEKDLLRAKLQAKTPTPLPQESSLRYGTLKQLMESSSKQPQRLLSRQSTDNLSSTSPSPSPSSSTSSSSNSNILASKQILNRLSSTPPESPNKRNRLIYEEFEVEMAERPIPEEEQEVQPKPFASRLPKANMILGGNFNGLGGRSKILGSSSASSVSSPSGANSPDYKSPFAFKSKGIAKS